MPFEESIYVSQQIRPRTRRRARNPLALWHLLSLDAPTVAALWTWFIGRVCGLRMPWQSIVAMALAVWILYSADRLLDARLLNAAPLTEDDVLEARHHFHHRHRAAFLVGIAICSAALTPLLLRLAEAALRLYLVEGALLVAWFLIIHLARGARRLPKELAVGPFFAAATFIPTVSRLPQDRLSLILPAVLFSALCSLNCLYIYAWEHRTEEALGRAHTTTRVALRWLTPLTFALICVPAGVALRERAVWMLPVACSLSAAALFAVHRMRSQMQPTTLRAAADLALLTPLLMLPLLPLLQ